MMQRVVDGISAQLNTKAYGSLSIVVQHYMTAKVAFIVPPGSLCASANNEFGHSMVREPANDLVQDEKFF